MIIHATIADLPVDLADWQCDSTVNHGDRSASGKIPESFTSAEQEAPLVLWLPNGEPLWQGKLALDPVTERGQRSISARGYAEDISADATRMFYRSDGSADWVDKDDDPHYDNANSVQYDLHRGPGGLRVKFGNNADSIGTGDSAGFLIWKQGALITRYRVRVNSRISLGGFDFRTNAATGPDGTQTVIVDEALSAAPPLDLVEDIPTPEDMLIFLVRRSGAATVPVTRRYVGMTQIKVYGRTTDDAFSASDVVSDVAGSASFDVANVQANALEVLPVDWTEDHADLLTYIAALTDWHWEAYGPEVHFGPWETTWTGALTTGVRPTWENQPRYNTVAVPFTSLSGVERITSAVADPDPFPGQTVTFTADALDAPQPNDDLADAVAANLTAYYSSRRVGGRLELARVTDATGRPAGGEEVRPGHLIMIPERADLGPQRIVGMNYRENGYPVAEINDDFNVIRLLNSIRVPKKKKKKRAGVGGPVR